MPRPAASLSPPSRSCGDEVGQQGRHAPGRDQPDAGGSARSRGRARPSTASSGASIPSAASVRGLGDDPAAISRRGRSDRSTSTTRVSRPWRAARWSLTASTSSSRSSGSGDSTARRAMPCTRAVSPRRARATARRPSPAPRGCRSAVAPAGPTRRRCGPRPPPQRARPPSARVVVPRVQQRRHAVSRIGPDDRRARRGQPGVAPVPVRRARRQGAQHRESLAEPAVGPHQGHLVGQPDVHLEGGGGRAQQTGELVDDPVVARRRGDRRRTAERCRRVHAGRQDPAPPETSEDRRP